MWSFKGLDFGDVPGGTRVCEGPHCAGVIVKAVIRASSSLSSARHSGNEKVLEPEKTHSCLVIPLRSTAYSPLGNPLGHPGTFLGIHGHLPNYDSMTTEDGKTGRWPVSL